MTPFPFQRGQIGLSRLGGGGADPYASVGFLTQFDSVSGGQVVSDVGPNVVLAGTSALDTSIKKWGAASLHVISGQPEMNLSGAIVNAVAGKAWRWEFWVYWVGTPGEANIQLETAVNNRGVRIGRAHQFSWTFHAEHSSPATNGTGIIASGTRSPLNTWVHVAVEQKLGQAIKLYDSVNSGYVADFPFSSGSTNMDGTCFNNLKLRTPCEYYLDSMMFRWFETAEEPLLYANAGYSVPTGPF